MYHTIKDIPYQMVKDRLKLSKSGQKNNEPYSAKWDDAGWWDIYDKDGTIVGQTIRDLSPKI